MIQNIDDDVEVISITNHAAYFYGDKWLWLKEHLDIIDWSGCMEHRAYAEAYGAEA